MLCVAQLQSILQTPARAFDVGIVCIAMCGEHRVYLQVQGFRSGSSIWRYVMRTFFSFVQHSETNSRRFGASPHPSLQSRAENTAMSCRTPLETLQPRWTGASLYVAGSWHRTLRSCWSCPTCARMPGGGGPIRTPELTLLVWCSYFCRPCVTGCFMSLLPCLQQAPMHRLSAHHSSCLHI